MWCCDVFRLCKWQFHPRRCLAWTRTTLATLGRSTRGHGWDWHSSNFGCTIGRKSCFFLETKAWEIWWAIGKWGCWQYNCEVGAPLVLSDTPRPKSEERCKAKTGWYMYNRNGNKASKGTYSRYQRWRYDRLSALWSIACTTYQLSFSVGGRGMGACHKRTLWKAWESSLLSVCWLRSSPGLFVRLTGTRPLAGSPIPCWITTTKLGGNSSHQQWCKVFVLKQGQAPEGGVSSFLLCPQWLLGTGPMIHELFNVSQNQLLCWEGDDLAGTTTGPSLLGVWSYRNFASQWCLGPQICLYL